MKYFSVSEAAARLEMSVRGLRARIERGEMSAGRVGRRVWAVGEDELQRWQVFGRQKPGPKPAPSAEGQIMLALAREIARRDAARDGGGFEPGWHRIPGNLAALGGQYPELRPDSPQWQAFARVYTEEYSAHTRNIPSPAVAAAPVATVGRHSRTAAKR
jgi:excisionase family DNA binding protein